VGNSSGSGGPTVGGAGGGGILQSVSNLNNGSSISNATGAAVGPSNLPQPTA